MINRRKFLNKILVLTGGVSAGAVLVKPTPVIHGNYDTVGWFNDKGIIIKTEQIPTNSRRTVNIVEHINCRDKCIQRLKARR